MAEFTNYVIMNMKLIISKMEIDVSDADSAIMFVLRHLWFFYNNLTS